MLDTAQLMAQVAGIRILTTRLLDDRLSGDYHSVFKGRGIEFDEVRPYIPGDDVRAIDWNVTARTGHPHIKRFSEERELTIMFLVDVSGSQVFGSTTRTKSELTAEITSLLAMTAIRNQDKIGCILFSDRIVKSIPPRKGRTAVMRLVREVLAAGETRHGTDIAGAIRFLNNVQKRRAVVFVVSDFQDTGYDRALRALARHHDVIACPVSDPRESTLPNVGLVQMQDPETGELVIVDTASRSVRDAFAAEASAVDAELHRNLRRWGIDTLDVSTGRPYIDDVRALFQRRRSRARRSS
ncbi:MAG: DUF58 domain-containing protein [Lentisphaerota bacterium]|jgi:uncharacterized protein (DUF58 family)